MSEFIIFHNKRCSKSRQTLQLLEQNHIAPSIVEYLNTPPTAEELAKIIALLGFESARELMRKGEDAYKAQNLSNPQLTELELIDAMINTPKLIERPIVIFKDKAVLGRPPENVLTLL